MLPILHSYNEEVNNDAEYMHFEDMVAQEEILLEVVHDELCPEISSGIREEPFGSGTPAR